MDLFVFRNHIQTLDQLDQDRFIFEKFCVALESIPTALLQTTYNNWQQRLHILQTKNSQTPKVYFGVNLDLEFDQIHFDVMEKGIFDSYRAKVQSQLIIHITFQQH